MLTKIFYQVFSTNCLKVLMRIMLKFYINSKRINILNSVFSPKITLLLLLSSRSVAADSLQPHGLQRTRLPCPLPSEPSGTPYICVCIYTHTYMYVHEYMLLLLFSYKVVSDSDPMYCSMPGFLTVLYFLEFAQTHVH